MVGVMGVCARAGNAAPAAAGVQAAPHAHKGSTPVAAGASHTNVRVCPRPLHLQAALHERRDVELDRAQLRVHEAQLKIAVLMAAQQDVGRVVVA